VTEKRDPEGVNGIMRTFSSNLFDQVLGYPTAVGRNASEDLQPRLAVDFNKAADANLDIVDHQRTPTVTQKQNTIVFDIIFFLCALETFINYTKSLKLKTGIMNYNIKLSSVISARLVRHTMCCRQNVRLVENGSSTLELHSIFHVHH